ncbi:MAG: anti-sigma factor antagonist [Microcystis sp. M04BS1]|jgi:anti-anti-sigma factor|uniref:Anti-sigma factor antagonist n=1 Tax=Microcystis aeruginosa Ma_MB_S_20031200_S102 TaxID=2486254 RepID=A0A552EUW8_MICAE|nr:anti-sigma factor antagonist [Microcystis aeruginosa]MCA2552685.1 anti-sigma factor antagonist [Microcystis sp. M04BS1]NCS24893.1 anti-sigma factor antagonist [Microcystis aeruginosa BS13-02]TRU20268.1 MAG: STAS domain-containing protein [Microcystis aeruginosa Ma_MB_S_20031200_S102D]TRU38255.1 MAG: STAS domain-containing protein [Microcystis aeruginosa Ma_MB_S_20031200_S102]MDB9506001.1 anti-sigma factor antagonist [Microcystis aeruginosa CS-338/01]
MTSPIPETRFLIIPMEYPVLRMPDRLTVLEALQFKDIFHHLIAQTPTPEKVILDLNATQFMDSSGVGSLVHNLKAARSKNIELVLANVHPPVMGVLSITGLDQLFTFQTPPLAPQENGLTTPENHLPETHPSIRSWLKRGLDIVGGIVGLLITGLIFAPIAIAIKLDSPGPIFFSQTRCGWLGKEFKILKFRSMCVDAETLKDKIPNQAQGAFFKNKNDPRITRVGKFLRRTSLDELPQFWNVIIGEMSLVGTRPPTPDEVERYDVPQWQRLDVKPGMTGEWQVNGRSQVRNFEEVIQLDLRYQENWSLGYDLQLIFKTILILFQKNSGAF